MIGEVGRFDGRCVTKQLSKHRPIKVKIKVVSNMEKMEDM
jgi:hypothetical protein